MNSLIIEKYPHLTFKKDWELDEETYFILGQCDCSVRAISDMPITPDYREELLTVSLTKGAQSTTAIEGNSLSDEEVLKIKDGESLPPSKEYQEKEVKNLINALQVLIGEVKIGNHKTLITPELIKRLHKMIGEGLGEYFAAIPGEFRNNNVTVSNYRPPDSLYVENLITELCDWFKIEFHFEKGQLFTDYIIQALVAHVYIAWIHPFSDGNGRTARLLEYYLLLRGGTPVIAAHILSNYYNDTRNEYYRHISLSTEKKSLTPFIKYAILGLRDGLNEILKKIQKNQLEISWKNFIIQKFDERKYRSKIVKKRQRYLMLKFPLETKLTINEILTLDARIALSYAAPSDEKNPSKSNIKSVLKIRRDIIELEEMGLLKKEDNKYFCNYRVLHITNSGN
ncbi:MAG: Fic family protein [Ignavibacteria bacterium]